MSGLANYPRRQARAWLAQLGALALALAVASILELPLAATTIAAADPPPPPSELVGQRTASSRTFDNHDGTYTTSLYSGPVHYRDGQGDRAWRPISSAVVPTTDSDDYALQNEANRFRTLFKSTLQADYLALETGGGRFKVTLQNAARVTAQAGPRRVTYPGVFSGVDLRYDLRPDGVKETLLLQNAQAPTSYRFLLTPPANARMHAAQGRDGSWAFFMAPHARPVFVIDAPWASENDEPDSRRRNASLAVSRIGDTFALDLSVDGTWLRALNRQFPVRLDPTITIQPTIQDASFDFACPGCSGVASDRLSIGTGSQGFSANTWRSALQFSLADIPPGATISNAKLKLYFDGTCVSAPGPACGGTAHQIDALRMTSSWSPSSTTSQLVFNLTPLASFTLPASAPPQWMNWDITGTVQNWASGGLPSNFGLLLKRTPEPANASGPKPPSRNYAAEPTLGPTLQVTYNGDGGELLEPETVHSNGAELHWTPYSGPGAPPFSSYEVHRSASPNFTPSALTRLTTIKNSEVTAFQDTTAKAGSTFTYGIVVSGVETNRRTVAMPAAGQARKLLRPDQVGSDTYITHRSDSIDCVNRGGLERLKVGTDAISIWRPLLRFDLGDIPPNSPVTEATLSLWHPETTTTAQTVRLHRMTANWLEGSGIDKCTGDGATWYESTGGARWAQDGGDFDATAVSSLSIPSGSQAGWRQWSLTSLVDQWSHATYPNDGVLLKLSDETLVPGKSIDFYASDFAVAPTLRPTLSVTYSDGSQPVGPTVSINKPQAGVQVKGSAVNVAAEAFDDRRVDSVQFFVGGDPIGTDTTTPFSITWNSTTATNGSHSLTARATDDVGHQTMSAAVAVIVGNSSPPTTSITSPVPPPNPPTVTGTVGVTASANDDFGVTKVELYADGILIGTDSSPPNWNLSWNTLDPALPAYDGQHVLTTKAYDAHQQVTTSAGVTVNVANAADTKYLADIVATGIPGRLEYDASAQSQLEYPVTVTVTNRSDFIWAAGEVVLGYRWVSADGSAIDGNDTFSLGTGPLLPDGSTLPITVQVEPPDLPAGVARAAYRLRFDLYEPTTTTWFASRGDQPLEQNAVVGELVREPMLGLEPYYEYESEELGVGLQHLGNVATGNSIVRWTPIQLPGIGLSTTVELTYNSGEVHCNMRFCPAGAGWSLAVSGLTRIGDLAFRPTDDDDPDEEYDVVDLIDANGTLLHFEWNGQSWVPPAGTHLYLREGSFPVENDTAQWAVTTPDRTTYFYKEVDADEAPGKEGLLKEIRDKNGNRLRFDLYLSGNDRHLPHHVVDQGGRSISFTYHTSPPGRLATITDHEGHLWEFCFGSSDENFQLQTVVQWATPGASCSASAPQAPNCSAPNRCVRFDYDEHGDHARLLTVTDPLGRPTVLTYQGTGRILESRTDREGAPTTFAYDALSDRTITTVTAPPLTAPRVTCYQDGATDAPIDGSIDRITHACNSGVSETTEIKWTAAPQPLRHVRKVIEAGGGYTQYAYNHNGLVTEQTILTNAAPEPDAVSTTLFEYESFQVDGNDPLPGSISQLKKRTEPNGVLTEPPFDDYLTEYFYDPAGNLTRVKDPTGAETVNTYNTNGTQASTTDPNGSRTEFESYDLNGFPQLVRQKMDPADPLDDLITRYCYNEDGLPLWVQDPLHAGYTGSICPDFVESDRQFRTVYNYDNLHRFELESSPKSTVHDGQKLIWSSTSYDLNDNVKSEHQPDYERKRGEVTEYEYDDMDRRTKVTEPEQGEVTTFTYDLAGREVRTTLPEGQTTPDPDDFVLENTYDVFDRVIVQTEYARDADGLPDRKTRRCYERNTGDLLWKVAPESNWNEQNSPDCNIDPAPSHTKRFTYDDGHRPLTETDPIGRQRTKEYDANGNVTKEIDEDGTPTVYEYSQRGELVKTIGTFSKDGNNQPTRTLVTKTVYDAAGNVRYEVSPRAWDACVTPPPENRRGCDPGVDGTYVTEYRYDEADRLTRIALPDDANNDRTYIHRAYDANGNLSMVSLPALNEEPPVPLEKRTDLDYWDPGWIRTSNDHVNSEVLYDYEAEGLQKLREAGHSRGKKMRWGYYPDGLLAFEEDRTESRSDYTYDLNDNLQTATVTRSQGSAPFARDDIEVEQNGFDELSKSRQQIGSDLWRFTKFGYDRNGNLTRREDDGTETTVGVPDFDSRLHTFTYDGADQLELHQDLGTDHLESAGDEQMSFTYRVTGWEQTRTLDRRTSSGWATKLWTRRDYFPDGDLNKVETRPTSSSPKLLEKHTLSYEQCPDGSELCQQGDLIYLNGNRTKDVFRLATRRADNRCEEDDCTTRHRYGPREFLIWEEALRPGELTRTTDWDIDLQMNVRDEYEQIGPDPSQRRQRRHYVYEGNRLRHAIDYTGTQPPHRWYRYRDGNVDCVTSTESATCPANAFGMTPDSALLEDYVWDQRDRLLGFSRFHGLDPVTSCYRHDPLDRPVREEEIRGPTHDCLSPAKRVTDFTYLGLTDSVSSETQTQAGSPGTTKTYSYGPGEERVGMTATGGVTGDFYYTRNIHTDVSLLVRAGDTTEPEASYAYRPYGTPDELSHGDPEDGDPLNAYRFNDKRFDSGSATLDMGARRYGSDIGRFFSHDYFTDARADLTLSRDPTTQGRYVYGAANPVFYSELDGHQPLPAGAKPPPNYRRFDIALPFIHDEIEDNRTSKTVSALSGYKHRGWKKRAAWLALPPPMKADLKAWALGSFYRNMKSGGNWDHKWQLRGRLQLNGPDGKKGTSDDDVHFPIRGNLKWEVYFDIWSNIHYGYIGRAASFPSFALIAMAKRLSDDDKWDDTSMRLGTQLWEDHGFDIGTRDIHRGILSTITKFEIMKRRDPNLKVLLDPRDGNNE